MTACVASVYITFDTGPRWAVCIEDELVHLDATDVDEAIFD